MRTAVVVTTVLLGACSGAITPAPDAPSVGAPGPHAGQPPQPGAATGPLPVPDVATSGLPRLSHRQWERTVRDLLRLPDPPNLARTFTGDPASGRFDNAGGALQVTQALHD